MPDRFLRVSDVAEMLGVSRSTIWRWQTERGLKTVSIGGVTRIRESDLDVFLKHHETNNHKPNAPDQGVAMPPSVDCN